MLSLDDHYRDTSHLSRSERAVVNYDEPAAFQLDAFVDRLAALRRGEAIARFHYDFSTGAVRTEGTLGPAEVVIAEGLFALWDPRIGAAADLRILLEGDAERLLERRIRRDGAERAYTAEEVRVRFETAVLPSQRRYLDGAARSADLVLPMDWDADYVALAARALSRRGPGRDTSGAIAPPPGADLPAGPGKELS